MKDTRVITNILFFTLFLDVLGASMLLPLIPTLFTDNTSGYFVLGRFEESYWIFIASLITAVYGFMQFIVAPLMGDLSDRFGRKLIRSWGTCVSSFQYFILHLGSYRLTLTHCVKQDNFRLFRCNIECRTGSCY